MNVPKLIMCVGLPCSGKSTMSQKLAIEYNAIVFSSDALREELFGNVNEQSRDQELFTELHKRIKNCLREGKNAIYDACNRNYRKRMTFLSELKNIPCEKICIVMATPYEECVRRSKIRERKVPGHVIKRMYMNWNTPYWHEGWDYITVVYSNGAKDNYGSVTDWVESVMNYDQHNSHHKLTLGQHCMKAFEYLDRLPASFGDLKTSALVHDCGKPKSATYINSKGEVTEECHYYNHNFCGSYDSLFFSGIDDHLYVAQLIQWHMRPYLAWEQSEKAKQKDKKLLGDRLFNDICLLHEADVNAH